MTVCSEDQGWRTPVYPTNNEAASSVSVRCVSTSRISRVVFIYFSCIHVSIIANCPAKKSFQEPLQDHIGRQSNESQSQFKGISNLCHLHLSDCFMLVVPSFCVIFGCHDMTEKARSYYRITVTIRREQCSGHRFDVTKGMLTSVKRLSNPSAITTNTSVLIISLVTFCKIFFSVTWQIGS